MTLGRVAQRLGVGVFVEPWAQISLRERLKTRLRPDSRVGGVRGTQGGVLDQPRVSPKTEDWRGTVRGRDRLRVDPPGQRLAWGQVLHTVSPSDAESSHMPCPHGCMQLHDLQNPAPHVQTLVQS